MNKREKARKIFDFYFRVHSCLWLKFLQISTFSLFFFNRNKQRLKITFTETFAAFALKNFIENCWAVFDGFGENLQQIAFFVAVN